MVPEPEQTLTACPHPSDRIRISLPLNLHTRRAAQQQEGGTRVIGLLCDERFAQVRPYVALVLFLGLAVVMLWLHAEALSG